MRNLVICLDGTWNKPDQQDHGRQVPSNVVKMARAVDLSNQSQCIYYDTGVGTGNFLDRIVGGITGRGISENIFQAFQWLIENYHKDDKLYLFGFSRGAYTARSLAGLIGVCGIPQKKQSNEMLKCAEKVYRTKDQCRRLELCKKFQEKYKACKAKVHFIGVWDTVGALGVPTSGPLGLWTRRRSGFHDVSLGAHVCHAYHAVTINERRGAFKPTLWNSNPATYQTLIQAWFPGVHSNVGGGYVDSGLSDRALLWMICNAYKLGLRFDKNYIDLYVHPNWFGELRDSMTWFYKLMFWNRPSDRSIDTTKKEFLHISANERWRHETKPEEPPINYRNAHKNKNTLIANSWESDFNRNYSGSLNGTFRNKKVQMQKTIHKANHPVILAETQIDEIDGDPVQTPVRVLLRCSHWAGITIESENFPANIFKKERFWMSLRDFEKIEVFIGSYRNIGGQGIKGSLIPTMQSCTVVDKKRPLHSVKFSILNLPQFYGKQDQWIEINNTGHRLGFARLEAPPWLIEIYETQNLSDNLKTLKKDGGYAITHTGNITYSNNKTFTVQDVEKLLSGLGTFLSFTRGAYCGLTLIEGNDQNGEQSWVQWGCSHYTKSWKYNQSETKINGGDFISEVFPEFWDLFTKGNDWKDSIIRAIDWYLNSNEGALHVGIILTQAALERLSYQILGQRFRPPGKFIQIALKKLNLDPQIPSSCPKLEKLRQINNWSDGPHTLTEIRNDFIHPQNKHGKIPLDVQYESWNLGQRYVELGVIKSEGHFN